MRNQNSIPSIPLDAASMHSPAPQSRQSIRRRIKFALLAPAVLFVLVVISGCHPPAPTAFLPTNSQDACPLSATTFDGWFQPTSVVSGNVVINGIANPANSLNAPTPNCGFYQWSENMFLWLTSPAPSTYGGGAHIFDSPTFYDVSPLNGTQRTLIPHVQGVIRAFPLRIAKHGPHGLPVVRDISGRLLETLPVDPKLKPRVRDVTGKIVVVTHARMDQGKLVLLDAKGSLILAAQPTIGAAANTKLANPARAQINPLIVQKFIIDGFNIFIDPTLAVITTEQGQAGDDSVLQAQTTANGSLVYYSTMVNDVYAYFLTGQKDCITNPGGAGAFCSTTTATDNEFPTTAADLANIMNYATAHGKAASTFPDQNALAIEVKSSWVLASSLPNANTYITMTATVPTYNTSNPNTWTPTGQQTVQLALVGMHVVGSTGSHPEMVWGSFEHQGNTPLAPYSYNNNATPSAIVNVNPPTSGTWLFAASNSTASQPLNLNNFNQPHMAVSGTPVANSIQSEPGFSISPSDTLRLQPFGMDGSNASSNSEILSTNTHVQALLAPGDVRANYFLIGATWTPFGSNPGPTNGGVGTNLLANSTMETYAQGGNCFECHQNSQQPPAGPTVPTTQISHVYPAINPLF
ncbi:MAG: hypothetical protein ABR907_10650 [Terracidiphilus sp.]|jgi:hypothetical protein